MNEYEIIWESKVFGKSRVKASSEREAQKKASNGEDQGFKTIKSSNLWDVIEIRCLDQCPITEKTINRPEKA